MSLLDSLEKYLQQEDKKIGAEVRAENDEEIITDGFQMAPFGSKYKVLLDGNEVCVVEFVHDDTGETTDIEIAQDDAENYIVYITEIKDKLKTDRYVERLRSLGFNNIDLGG